MPVGVVLYGHIPKRDTIQCSALRQCVCVCVCYITAKDHYNARTEGQGRVHWRTEKLDLAQNIPFRWESILRHAWHGMFAWQWSPCVRQTEQSAWGQL